jgi:two-component system sensor histidine kinase YesM
MVKSDDKENAVYFSRLMGTYFQFITRSKGSSVQLCKEIEHARIYTQIQGMRFVNRITIQFDPLPQEFEGVLVPRLIVQPILENAFQYALSDKLSDGVLRVRFASAPEYLIIDVEDNGDQLTDEKIQGLRENLDAGDIRMNESIGLLNIHRRLQAAFPDRGRLEINRSALGGMQVLLYIPLQGASEGKNV